MGCVVVIVTLARSMFDHRQSNPYVWPKSRAGCHFAAAIGLRSQLKDYVRTVPDFAIDQHTLKAASAGAASTISGRKVRSWYRHRESRTRTSRSLPALADQARVGDGAAVLSCAYDQKLRWARSCSNTVFWSLNSYSAVGFGAVAVNTELPDIF
jgi:hypothetical protein